MIEFTVEAEFKYEETPWKGYFKSPKYLIEGIQAHFSSCIIHIPASAFADDYPHRIVLNYHPLLKYIGTMHLTKACSVCLE